MRVIKSSISLSAKRLVGLQSKWCALAVALAAWTLSACGDDDVTAVDGSVGDDLGRDSDARVICGADVDCNDGLFCNGREMCAPASTSADVRGCVPGDAPCSAGETCDEVTNDCRTSCDDLDGDGRTAVACGGDDCDDADATRFPGGAEVCDADDEDCNDTTYGFVDADGDGVGAASCCNGGACATDCDDSNASVRPGIADGPTMNCNGVDDDCDGVPDVGCPCADGERRPCYGGPAGTRGVGLCVDGVAICAGGMLGSECLEDVLPASEVCNGIDDDCDGMIDEGVIPRFYVDVDGDGYGQTAMFIEDRCNPPMGYVAAAGDCDDTLPTVRPSAPDLCNTIDDDCDGMIDEGAPQGSYYRDDDRDGYGLLSTLIMACSAPAGFVPASGDCDDTRAGTSPVGVEVCDAAMPPLDEDCDSTANEGCTCVDGASQACGGGAPVRGACRAGVQRCIAGRWAGCTGNVDPGTLTETCNGIDDDCDGMTDESLLAASCQADADSDGYGSGAVLTTLCRDAARATTFGACPSGYSNVGGDCNDANSGARPGGTEICDVGNVDDNCNGSNNEGCACANGSVQSCGGGGRGGTGICRSGTQRCVSGAWLPCEGNVEPAVETCNGLDDNCLGGTDEGVTVTVYRDSDGDTYGVGTGVVSCAASAGFATRAGDCNDANPAVRPGSTEVCNDLDDDCDLMIDEGFGCRIGATSACTTTCGTAGTRTCTGACTQGDCATDDEGAAFTGTCNACDDDGDGRIDDNFACSPGQILACTTPCGTPGTRVCTGTCAATAPCVAAVETCNFCDDDGDGTALDDEFVAFDRDTWFVSNCSMVRLSGLGTPATCTTGTTGFAYQILSNTANDVGAMSARSGPSIQYGPITVSGYYNVFSGLPGTGAFAVALYTDEGIDFGTTSFGGVNIGRQGVFAMWSFDGNTNDEIRVYRLNGGAAPTFLNSIPISTLHSFNNDSSSWGGTLSLTYEPPNTLAGRPTGFISATGSRNLTSGTFTTPRVPVVSIGGPGAFARGALTGANGTDPHTTLVLASFGEGLRISTERNCINDGTARLAPGGRVEVWAAGAWGTVCDDGLTSTTGAQLMQVLCRQLGRAPGSYLDNIATTDGTGAVNLDDVVCGGSETSLRQCGSSPWGMENCDHSEDIGATCL